ncbi:MAG: glycosyltransferase family 4 protein [Spirochaetes bacterium]|nr:glycosyltransferase family 4 protein [Spirochaetota bacterium]
MKICLLSYRGNPYCGGQGVYLMYIARELVKMGHEVHAIVGPPYPFEMEGVTLHRISNHNYFNIAKNYIKPHKPFATFQPLNFYEFMASKLGIFPEIETFSFRAFLKLKELVKTHRFDIIHDNQCLGYGFLLIKLLGIPFVSTLHHPLTVDRSTWFEYPSDFSLRMKRVLYYPLIMQKIVTNRMDHIITVSHDSKREIHEAFGTPLKKQSVVYNGLDSSIFQPMPGVRKVKNSVIFVGNVEDRKKGVSYMLRAISLTRNRVHLTIVDGGAPNRRFVPHWIDKFGINDRITFAGKVTNEKLVELYNRAEIALSPSLYEGFGFPAAEAMACELPVIASTAGALPEVVGEHMETAMVVPPRDPQAIADAIDYLVEHPEKREEMGKAARKRVLATFTWENAAKEMVKVYGEVIRAYR